MTVLTLSSFEVTDEGAEFFGDVEYDESNTALCPMCGFRGTWGDFQKANQKRKKKGDK